jgi:hypothetical protein
MNNYSPKLAIIKKSIGIISWLRIKGITDIKRMPMDIISPAKIKMSLINVVVIILL